MNLTPEELKAQRWAKSKVRNVYRIEEDGSKTTARVVDYGNRVILHNHLLMFLMVLYVKENKTSS